MVKPQTEVFGQLNYLLLLVFPVLDMWAGQESVPEKCPNGFERDSFDKMQGLGCRGSLLMDPSYLNIFSRAIISIPRPIMK